MGVSCLHSHPQGQEGKGMLGDGSWSYWEQMGRDGGGDVGEAGGQPRGGGVVGLCEGGNWADPSSPRPLGSRANYLKVLLYILWSRL